MEEKDQQIVLEMSHVEKHFGGVHAIDDFSVKVMSNRIHGLIGPNGAGKTTIFNNITGIYKPDSGVITLCSKEITNLPPHQIAKEGIARTFQNIRLFGSESVIENVMMACNMNASYNLVDSVIHTPKYKKSCKEIEEKAKNLLDIVGLYDKKDERSSSLPYGHQRKLEIARAMALDPKLLLLDEPAAGMNEEESEDLVRFVSNIRDRFGIAILMIEHHMNVVTKLCDECTVLNFGKTLAVGTPAEVTSNPEVITAYLGGED